MKKLLVILLLLFPVHGALAKPTGVVVHATSCDWFIVDGPGGLFLWEWFGGHVPSEGDTVTLKDGGKLTGYAMREVVFNGRKRGKVWRDDFYLGESEALRLWSKEC